MRKRNDGNDRKDGTLPLFGARVAFIGFGEAAEAFLAGWRSAFSAVRPTAFDIKTESGDAAIAAGKRDDYRRMDVDGRETLAEALAGTDIVFSLVTADAASEAARAAAAVYPRGALFFDCNSCAPATKQRSAEAIAVAGGRYVDAAVMAPVHPKLHKTPFLISGLDAEAGFAALGALAMVAEIAPGGVGAASAIKMTRSIMIKGLEALVLECVLTGRAAGVDEVVLASLDASFPGFDWKSRAAYMMERVMTHGVRRAAEMREVVATVEDAGLSGDMARATVAWQQAIGDLGLDAATIGDDYGARADAILATLVGSGGHGRAINPDNE